jgi:hypothetical protein
MQRKAENDKRRQEERDQLDLCGEEFITGIHEMLKEYDAFEAQVIG